jgi:Virus neck protein
MAGLRLFNSVWNNENTLIEGLIVDALKIWGQDFYYIPRHLVAKDDILGEDRLSQFKTAYPIVAYMENSDNGFEGQGAFASKFGLQMDQSAEITIAKREWNKLVGRFGETILPNRPAEGDLLYFPMTKGLFEINFVQSQSPFYQVGQLYVYRLTIDLFRYSAEKLDTGVPDIDIFESLKSLAIDVNLSPDVPVSYGDNDKFKNTAPVWNANNPFGDIK